MISEGFGFVFGNECGFFVVWERDAGFESIE